MSISFKYLLGNLIPNLIDILRNWKVGIGDLSYLDVCIFLGFGSIVITAAIVSIRIGIYGSYSSISSGKGSRSSKKSSTSESANEGD